MVSEKESKAKEGMKIMGLGEDTYFLSYFIQYVIITLIDSLINTLILTFIFTKVPFYFLFVILVLWTLDLFAMIYFFQSFLDSTRVALIISLLIYFATYFLSMACMDEGAAQGLKIGMSILFINSSSIGFINLAFMIPILYLELLTIFSDSLINSP